MHLSQVLVTFIMVSNLTDGGKTEISRRSDSAPTSPRLGFLTLQVGYGQPTSWTLKDSFGTKHPFNSSFKHHSDTLAHSDKNLQLVYEEVTLEWPILFNA